MKKRNLFAELVEGFDALRRERLGRTSTVDFAEAEIAALRAELEEAKAQAADAQATVRQQEERLGQAAESYTRLVNASCYSDRDDESMSPEAWVNSVVASRNLAELRLNFLVSEGLQVYESNNKFRLRQVMDACTIGKSYDTAREAIDAALTEGIPECQCKGEICE